MAGNFQEQSRTRKIIYIAVIVALFTTSLFHRRFVIANLADRLQLGETRGESELTSSAVRLTLLGSRGLATCVLWQMAMEKQKRHQWNELEMLVRSITKLQPNFVTPWRFQSWNLAYNVAVECDRPRDKYFYVTRGLVLLAEGDRRHQGTPDRRIQDGQERYNFPGNPDIRHDIGQFYQMKIGNSDEKNVMRCLLEISMIDPIDRDPNNGFWMQDQQSAQGKTVNLKKFLEFCKAHPRLVRRLYRKLRCQSPRAVLKFLEDNADAPSRFVVRPENLEPHIPTPLLKPQAQFPIVPPLTLEGEPIFRDFPNQTRHAWTSHTDEDVDVYVCSRWWFQYAQLPLPKPTPTFSSTEWNQNEMAKLKNRLPKMMTRIFRGYPARAQEYSAETRAAEGWFDEEGWVIEDWFQRLERDQGTELGDFGEGKRVGHERRFQAQRSWEKAYQRYRQYGIENGLLLLPTERKDLEAMSRKYVEYYKGLPPRSQLFKGMSERERAKANGLLGKAFDAYRLLKMNDMFSSTTNFDAHYIQCKTERLSDVTTANKLLFQAQEKLIKASPHGARRDYEVAFAYWTDVLLRYPKYRELDTVQDDTHEHERKYINLKLGLMAPQLRKITPVIAQFGLIDPVLGFNLPIQVEYDVTDEDGKKQTLDQTVLLSPPPIALYDKRRDQFRMLDSDQVTEILPLIQVYGPVARLHTWQPSPEPEVVTGLKNYFLLMNQMTLPVPFVISEVHRDWMFTKSFPAQQKSLPTNWHAVIEASIIERDISERLARLRARNASQKSQRTTETKPGS